MAGADRYNYIARAQKDKGGNGRAGVLAGNGSGTRVLDKSFSLQHPLDDKAEIAGTVRSWLNGGSGADRKKILMWLKREDGYAGTPGENTIRSEMSVGNGDEIWAQVLQERRKTVFDALVNASYDKLDTEKVLGLAEEAWDFELVKAVYMANNNALVIDVYRRMGGRITDLVEVRPSE